MLVDPEVHIALLVPLLKMGVRKGGAGVREKVAMLLSQSPVPIDGKEQRNKVLTSFDAALASICMLVFPFGML